jgi:anaerobic selenocysteine-containing dehydrogenase
VLWGNNPHSSNLWHVPRIQNAINNGAKLIVIDPRRTTFAKKADIHVQPRPGTDAALALSILHTIISEGLYDSEFVQECTYGFDRFAQHVKKYTPEEVELISNVSAEDIRKTARMFAAHKPACIIQGTNCLDQQASGFQNSRAIAILEAITGNLDVPGGCVRVTAGLHLRPFNIAESETSLMLGADKYPIANRVFNRIYHESQAADWADTILNEKPWATKAMIIAGSNAVVTQPNSTKVQQALKKVDLLVVMDIFMTATAEMADIVLPACTFLERTELCDVLPAYFGPEPWAMLRKQVVQPLWESWPDGKFWLELGKEMGYNEYFPWKDLDEVMDYFLEPTGLTAKYLTEEAPWGVETAPKFYDEYKQSGFNTPSGKVELYSDELEKLGYDPLPTYYENPETAISNPDLAKDYPLVLTTGARIPEYWHSQHRNVPALRRRVPDPTFEVHPETAKRYGVADGEWAFVETKRGSIEIKAKVTEDIAPNVISVPHGWQDANVNILTDNTPADPVSGYPVFKGLLCRIRQKT